MLDRSDGGSDYTAKITGIDSYTFPHSLCGSVYIPPHMWWALFSISSNFSALFADCCQRTVNLRRVSHGKSSHWIYLHTLVSIANLERWQFANVLSESRVLRAHWDFVDARRRKQLILEFHLNKLVNSKWHFRVTGSIFAFRLLKSRFDKQRRAFSRWWRFIRKIDNISIAMTQNRSFLMDSIIAEKANFLLCFTIWRCTRQRVIVVALLSSLVASVRLSIQPPEKNGKAKCSPPHHPENGINKIFVPLLRVHEIIKYMLIGHKLQLAHEALASISADISLERVENSKEWIAEKLIWGNSNLHPRFLLPSKKSSNVERRQKSEKKSLWPHFSLRLACSLHFQFQYQINR